MYSLPLARHFEARLSQGGDNLFTIPHHAVLDTLEQVVPDRVVREDSSRRPAHSRACLDVGAVSGVAASCRAGSSG